MSKIYSTPKPAELPEPSKQSLIHEEWNEWRKWSLLSSELPDGWRLIETAKYELGIGEFALFSAGKMATPNPGSTPVIVGRLVNGHVVPMFSGNTGASYCGAKYWQHLPTPPSVD